MARKLTTEEYIEKLEAENRGYKFYVSVQDKRIKDLEETVKILRDSKRGNWNYIQLLLNEIERLENGNDNEWVLLDD